MGSFAITTTSTNDITGRIEWTESNVSIANNTSDLNVKLIYRMNASQYATLGSGYFKITVNGVAYEDNHYVTFASGTHEYTVLDHTFTITHDANGAKTVSIVLNNGYVAGTSGLSASSGSGTATLTTIARASQPTATNTTYGSSTTVTTNRASSSFTHTLTFTQGSSLSQTVTGVGSSYSWTVPENWASAIAATATSTTIAVTCVTYNGSTNIGTKTTTFTVSIPASWKPTVSITPSYTNIGSNNKVLANVTGVTLTASATATMGSTISSYAWSQSASGTASTYSHVPSSTGTYNYTVTVTDARGRTNAASISITVYDSISTFTCDNSVNFGDALSVSIGRAKSTFTHVVRYYINNSHTVDVNDENRAWTSYTIPASWAEVIPTATTTTMTVTVFTYNGSSLLGSRNKSVTVVVPSSWIPDFTLTAEGINEFNSLNLKGVTKVKYTASSASPSTGSQIQSYSFTGNNLSKTITTTATSATATSDLLSVVGTNTFTVKVTDKRGRVRTKTSTLTVTDYSVPTLRISVGRYDSGGTADNFGGYGRIVANGTYSSVTGNTWTLTLKQKKKSDTTYTTVNTYSSQTGSISKTSSLFTADVDSAYDCQATLTDAVGKSVTVTVALSTGKALMDLFKDTVATFFSTASESLRTIFSSPSTLFYSNADKNVLNGQVYIPAKGTDGMTEGFTSLNQSMINRNGVNYSDFNSYTESGIYYINPTATTANRPENNYGLLEVMMIRSGIIFQRFTPYNNNNNNFVQYIRTYVNSQWYGWAKSNILQSRFEINDGTNSKLILHGDNEGGNIREYAPDGSYIEMDQYNSTTWRLYAANSAGTYKAALTWDKTTDVNLSTVWTSLNSLNTMASANSSVSIPTASITNIVSYTPGKTGRYLILCDVNWSTDSSATDIVYVARLNSSNSVLTERYIRASQAGGGGACLGVIYALDATDKIRIRVYQASGAASTARYNYYVINLRNS